jgi:hypothetical protein
MAEPASPKELPQPENQGAWKSATDGLLGSAKSVTDELLNQLKDKDVVHFHNRKFAEPYVNPGPKNQAELHEKVSVTRIAASTVDGAIQFASQCMIRLGHEQQKKWAPLKVCEWRLALRARRPTRELFKDHVTESLEKEQQSLLEARSKLSELVNEGKAILEDCEANKARLVRNVQSMVMLGTAKLPDHSGCASSASSPSSPPQEAAANAEGEEASLKRVKPVVPSDPAGLVARAPRLSEMVESYVKKGDNAIRAHTAKCKRAHEVVMIAFKKRWAENEVLKKSLEQQIHAMDETIYSSEKSLVKMKKRIDFFAEVQFQPQYDVPQDIFVKLRASKVELEDDFHHKLVAMKIDECCRKITPERTGVPPENVPVAAMLESRRKKPVARNSSSPALTNTGNSLRPGSPAGVSSSLKAAGAVCMA